MSRVGIHGGSGDVRAPLIDVHRIRRHEAHVTIDPRSGVPARVGLLRVVHADGDHVAGATVVEIRRELVLEGAVAVGPLPQVVPVDPDLAIAVHAVELDEHEPARILRGHEEDLAVPPHAAGQRPTPRTGRVLLAEFPLDAPVVRQVERAPGGVGERRFLCCGNVPEMESPIAIEGERRPLLGRRWRAKGDEQRVDGGDGCGRCRDTACGRGAQ